MMSKLRYWLMDYRVRIALVAVLGVALAAFGYERLVSWGGWLAIGAVVLLFLWLLWWTVKSFRAHRAEQRLERIVATQADQAVAAAKPAARAETEVLRERMNEAVKAIKSSKLGVMKGEAALYELPWYVIIGNPAAGKSTAILNSGLRFPFEDNRSNVIHGLGGTRNCDWYFTTEGIVLDTAGRYTVNAEDRQEWFSFLGLLKKNRPRAPINGIIIAASIAELSASKPEFAIELAKNLRQRVQELTERLEVFAPVYVVFTKADLISGFAEFFHGLDPSEREGVWGATLPYDPKGEAEALTAFDARFDELSEGLKEMSVAQMALRRGRELPPGLLTMPLEFAGIKPALRTFIATLFEDNPYQFKPVFRGFYFTSALQDGAAVQPTSERIAQQFSLGPRVGAGEPNPHGDKSHFVLGLFRKVIFADRQLVRRYASPTSVKLRYVAFFASVALLAIALTGWTVSYTANKQLVSNVVADLDKAVALQKGKTDLKSRIDALLVLQDRLTQLKAYREDHPLQLGLGLYQGERIEAKLRQEYFNGMRQLMLQPVATRLEGFLAEVHSHRGDLKPIPVGGVGEDKAVTVIASESLYQEPSAANLDDAYNALKTYLMISDSSRGHIEAAHLNDQLTRYWRGWLEANRGNVPRESMSQVASKLMSFYVAESAEPNWPLVEPKFNLVEQARAALGPVMKGAPAVERVFAQIKQRAQVRFPPITVDSLLGEDAKNSGIAGSYAIPGAFSRTAWEQYVEDAVEEASSSQLSSTDWVLEQTVTSDLSLAGSPEHIAKELVAMYKAQYALEWRKFMRGVSVPEFGTFDQAATRTGSLADPAHSPLRKLLEAVNRETVWDNPGAEAAAKGLAKKGLIEWFNRVVMRRNTTGIPMQINPATGKEEPVPTGPIGAEFRGLARLMTPRDNNPPLIDEYFAALGKLHTRLNAIKTEGDPGPGARKLMQDTLENQNSELAEVASLVDEQIVSGLSETQREALRPLLMRPLISVFAALVRPAEGEINRAWTEQVYTPFQSTLASKYPFNTGASVEAAQADINTVFGASGAIANFSKDALGPLVVRRGNAISPRQWAQMGIALRPEFTSNLATWVAGEGSAAAAGPTAIFEVMPLPASGREYTVVVDGDSLRYRNTPPTWKTFQTPGPGAPGVSVSAVTMDGRTVEVFNSPGQNGMKRLFDAAQPVSLGKDHYRLTLGNSEASVAFELRVISTTRAAAPTTVGFKGLQLPSTVAGGGAPVAPSPSAPAAIPAGTTAAGATTAPAVAREAR